MDARMVTADLYRQVMGNWATGVTIVSTIGREGRPYGLTVSSFTSVSLDPVLILVCLDNRLSGLQDFKTSGKFGVSVLSESQEDVSRVFARKDTERPAELYDTGATGVPLIRDALATLECETVAMYEGGDHTIFLGKVQAAELRSCRDGQGALAYFRGKYHKIQG
jgi:flavin reductase (DIM6/NTAB) family NADH-FMN oxidoreductase RutF